MPQIDTLKLYAELKKRVEELQGIVFLLGEAAIVNHSTSPEKDPYIFFLAKNWQSYMSQCRQFDIDPNNPHNVYVSTTNILRGRREPDVRAFPDAAEHPEFYSCIELVNELGSQVTDIV